MTAPPPVLAPATAPVLAAAAEVAAELAADATRLEQEGVDRALLQRLGAAGLLATLGSAEHGGVDTPTHRRVAELLAGASPDAWFVWFQHGPVVKMLASSDNTALQEAHLADLCAGRTLGGVAWSNLRTARPSVFATRVDGGWSLSGPQPWCTGWGLHDLVLVGGLAQDSGEVVFGIVPSSTPGLASTGELHLAAMAGTSTHAVRYDGLVLPDEAVVLRADFATWSAVDRGANTNVQPSTFGIALAALDLLEEREPGTAGRLRAQLLPVREQAYRLLDEVHPSERHDERLALRARALLLAIECATALLAARGGQGMDLGEPAQRLLRAAAFQLVHSQASHIRAATLDALAA